MSQSRDRLLRILADGHFHSGARLAEQLGVSRTAVWKQVQRLGDEFGLAVDAVRGRGYRLPRPLELLDREAIRAGIGPSSIDRLDALQVVPSTASTNAAALADLPGRSGMARVWLAEYQQAGRGRRGRQWVSTFGENLYLSLAWRFELPLAELAGLSLAAGVVVCETLTALGVSGHTLKWPNDILVDDRKLGGILVEAAGETGGPAVAVIGIGLNLRLSAAAAAAIGQPWASLEQLGTPVSRNALAGTLIDRLIAACRGFHEGRLDRFLPAWQRYDGLPGRPVRILLGDRQVDGIYRGVTDDGAAVIETAQGCSEFHAGEVSLRKAGSA